jgi:6-phosphogluconolactonase/glucosamine-6-phosphate isomerase/deaminase
MGNKFQIFKQPDSASSAAEAGENLNAFLTENIKLPVLLMLSGGSGLSISIIDYVGRVALGANLTISMLDERFSQDPQINNFLQLQKTDFYKDAFEAEASFFGTLPRSGETMDDLRQRWDKNLKTWRAENPRGLIAATLGMGPDGHTAGILPFPEDPIKFESMFGGEAWTAAYDAGNKNQHPQRVTSTLTFLKMVGFGFAFVAGRDKQEKFDLLISRGAKTKTAELPAAIWHKMKSVKVFTEL